MHSQEKVQLFVVYQLDECGGIYDKTGYLVRETEDDELIFKTRSETYRIDANDRLARKQRNGWYPIGEVEHIREAPETPSRSSSK